jgi:hypothetical protein
MEQFIFGIIGVCALIFIMKKYSPSDLQNITIDKLVVLFVILLSIYFIMNSSKKMLNEGFEGLKCHKKNKNGENLVGCYYTNKDETNMETGVCNYKLPEDKICPDNYEQYLAKINENSNLQQEETEEDKLSECVLEKVLLVLPKLTDEQIEKIKANKIDKLKLNGKDLDLKEIKACLEQREKLKAKILNEVSEGFQNQENKEKELKERNASLRGVAENSNNKYMKELLNEIIGDIKQNIKENKKEEEVIPPEKGPRDGFIIIPGKGKQPIYNYFDSNVSNINGLNFNNRDDFIEYSKKYVCNRSPHEIQAYKILGENVNKLDWWVDASRTHKPTPDNKLNLQRI